MSKFRYLKPRYLADHFDALVSDGYYERFMDGTIEGQTEDLLQWAAVRVDATIELVKRTWKMIVCDVRGHDYKPDGVDFIDSGGEGFSCERCGHSFTAWH